MNYVNIPFFYIYLFFLLFYLLIFLLHLFSLFINNLSLDQWETQISNARKIIQISKWGYIER